MFAGEDTLLVEHPGATGKKRGVLGIDAVAMYVIVNASPEHGVIPEHSLFPEPSIVEASTAPGPLAVPTVQVPF